MPTLVEIEAFETLTLPHVNVANSPSEPEPIFGPPVIDRSDIDGTDNISRVDAQPEQEWVGLMMEFLNLQAD